jgi:3-oxoacyl-(acyl-carrier-protein) synthase
MKKTILETKTRDKENIISLISMLNNMENKIKEKKITTALSNSFGFGGHDVAVICPAHRIGSWFCSGVWHAFARALATG